jgi:hypothetical protein
VETITADPDLLAPPQEIPARCLRERSLLLKLLPRFGPWLAGAISWTLNFRFLNRGVRDAYMHSDRPFIATLWHQHMLMALHSTGGRRIVLLSSRSRDGELSARLIQRMGHTVVRGSSSAGGAHALRQLTGLLRDGHPAVLTPDGPCGPAHHVKLGCVLAARDAGVPLIPMGCAVSRAIRLHNWDRTAIPRPFSKVAIAYGEPMAIPPDATREDCESVRRRLEERMERLAGDCRRNLGASAE